ncbi:MAG: lytic transglycosylase domain-containing protein [Sedimentitalea sp.]
MTRIAAMAICLCGLIGQSALADASSRLTNAMTELRAGNWSNALQTAGRDGTVASDIIEWHRLRAGRGTAPQVVNFLNRRPNWPGLAFLRRKSEPAIAASGTAGVLDFYKTNPPQTAEGMLNHATALIARGERGEGEAELVLAWRTQPMGRVIQATYLRDFATLLAPHHTARLDRLLWDNHLASARRMLSLVDEGHRALAQARIALREQAPGVNALIDAVPEPLRTAPGLAFERFFWRDRKGLDDSAIELLLERSTSRAALGEPDKWATRRAALARQTMRAGDPTLAYQIASRNVMTEGSRYADLEWLSGFLALRKLNDPATALRHFQNFDGAVASPISKGRAGYWIGRAHEALGDIAAAQAAYGMGARFQTSFYGLLAAERGGIAFDPNLATPPQLPPWREAPFMRSSVLEAGLLLLAAGEPVLAERFLTHLVETLGPVEAAQLGQMVVDMNQPHLAVMIAKRAARQAIVLHGAYYPLHPVAQMPLPMAPEMVLAIARRESEFDPVVISGAGARGLMQVMPGTAKLVARDLGILASHNTARLLSDWRYNAKLGANYLATLAGQLGGNVVMMAAGYNAGPGRPIQWMERFGDPRTTQASNEDAMVDWIEMIPFNETRNYVMRVAESLPVYRARTGQKPLPVAFSRELVGSTLRAFAP